jgi:hypothetical protein
MIMDEILSERRRPRAVAPTTERGPHLTFSDVGQCFDASRLAAKETVDFLWRCNDVQHTAVRFADTKACAAMLLSRGLVASAYQPLGAGKLEAGGFAGAISLAMLAMAVLSFLTTVVSVALAIRPRNVTAGRRRGFLFYRDICVRYAAGFVSLVADALPEELAEELARDV